MHDSVSVRLAVPQEQAAPIPGPAGLLEARWYDPGEQSTAACAVICHPHPLFGGTMDNKVVTTLARTAARCGASTVRFNFRGVGASEGSHGGGPAEVDDVIAVIDWALGRWPRAAIWLGGFSFGAYVALAAASQRRVERLVTVAPPVGRMALHALPVPACGWLILQGSSDELVDASQVQRWSEGLVPRPRLVMLQGATHFFHGRLAELSAAVADFLS